MRPRFPWTFLGVKVLGGPGGSLEGGHSGGDPLGVPWGIPWGIPWSVQILPPIPPLTFGMCWNVLEVDIWQSSASVLRGRIRRMRTLEHMDTPTASQQCPTSTSATPETSKNHLDTVISLLREGIIMIVAAFRGAADSCYRSCENLKGLSGLLADHKS